jgi:23S rRNA (uridine2552-2'-O)-methyltransferase
LISVPKKRSPRNAKNRGRSVQYPISVGEEFEVTIFDVAPNGEGVAKIKNYPVFIKGAKLNERVKVRLTSISGGAADAEIVQ